MKNLYLVVSGFAYGKGWTLSSAFLNIFREESSFYASNKASIIRYVVPEDATYAYIWMDDLGNAHSPEGTKRYRYEVADISQLRKAYGFWETEIYNITDMDEYRDAIDPDLDE